MGAGQLGGQLVVLCYVGAFAVLMRRTLEPNGGKLPVLWWPVMGIAAGFAVFTIVQAPASAFGLMAVMLALGTGLYVVARRGRGSI